MRQIARTTTEAELLTALMDGKLQLWTIASPSSPAIAVTMIADYPNLRVLSVLLLAGRAMHEWRCALIRSLEAFGRDQGCTELEAMVRPALAGAVYRPRRASLPGWRAEKTLLRRVIPPCP